MKKYILMMLLSFLLVTKGKAGYFVIINESVSWTEARSICQSAGGDTLLDSREDINNTCTRQYLQKPARYWMGFYSVLTPYISHHGCFQIINPLDADHNTTIAMIMPSVGTCFDHCQNYQRFGIMKDICICLDEQETNVLINKVNRTFCNVSCNIFLENEYCGGLNGHLNLYHISMLTENGPRSCDKRCLYLECLGPVVKQHQVECRNGLLGRVCENVIEHQDNVTYQEARSKCGQWYLHFEHPCDSNKIQANVKYWVDVKRYQIPKRVTGHHEFHDFHTDIPDLFSCLFYDTSKDQVLFGKCSMLNYAICETETVSSDEYPYCPKDQNEANEFQSTTEQGNLESHSSEIDITKVTDCTYCSSNNGGAASATLEYTESSQIRTRNKELDTGTIWGPILGIVIVIGCVVGGVVFYRYRRASEAKEYENQKNDSEDPNRNYFVLEAKTSQSNAGGTAKTNYDNVNAQCTTEKESVYAEQPDTVYDHLGKHRQLKLDQDRVPDDIYADGSTNAAADIGDYNTLNDTYRQREALSIIQDGDGYGHLDNVVSNRNIDSDYDHCLH